MHITRIAKVPKALWNWIHEAWQGRLGRPSTSRPTTSFSHKNRPKFGSAKGMIQIADDFDDPLPDFEEYMS